METCPRIAVLIPCYNEETTVGKVIQDFRLCLPDAQIYVYDNNSTDGTYETAVKAGAIVVREPRRGKGTVMRRMFADIDADVYILVDGDDTYPAESAKELIAPIIDKKADMVVGDRLSSTYFTANKRPFHNSGNRFVRWIINTIFHSDIKDVLSGYRAFSYDFVKNFPILSDGFEVETEMTLHALDRKYNIMEIPVEYRDRPEDSSSKLNTISDGYRVLQTVALLFKDYRPFVFFSLSALALTIPGLCLISPVLAEYWETGLVPRFPSLIVACFFFAAALLLFIAGIILSSIAKNNRRMFELMRIHTRNFSTSCGKENDGQ